MTTRRGMSLHECLWLIAVVLPLAGSALVLAHRLAVMKPPADGRLLEATTLRLRQDAQAGVRWDGTVLRAGDHAWTVDQGWWCRDGVQRVAVTAVDVTPGLRVRITAPGLPPRELWLGAAP